MGDWRAWVASAMGPGARVGRVRRLRGGVTSVVHAVDVDDADGLRHRLVLRRYPPGGVIAGHPEIVPAEVRALELLAAAGVEGTPRLVAVDLDGAGTGQPAVLSTRLAGRPILATDEPLPWADALADTVLDLLDRLRAVPADDLEPYRAWYPVGTAAAAVPPAWVSDSDGWRRAMGSVAHELPGSARPSQAIHRDLNPGNVLWHRGRTVGVVDWVHLCRGPIEEDIGRCRVNLWLLAGQAVADRFLATIQQAGIAYDLAWDLAVIADMAPWLQGILAANELGANLTEDVVHRRAEALVLARTRH